MCRTYRRWISCGAIVLATAGLGACSGESTAEQANPAGQADVDASTTDASDSATDAVSCDAEINAALWTERDDRASTLIAPSSGSTVTVDGVVDEDAYLFATRLSFTDVTEAEGYSDDQINAYAAWSQSALTIAMEVVDPSIEAASGEHPSQSDGVEIFLDTRRDGTHQMSDDIFHWVLGVEHDPQLKRADQQDSNVTFDSAVSATADGYAVELRIPFEQLEFTPQLGSRLGVLLVGNDRDDGVSRQFSWGGIRPFKNPAQWADIRLAPTPAAVCDRPAGGDAGTNADAGPADAGADTGPDTSPDAGSSDPNPCCNPELAAQGHQACLGAQFDTVLDAVADLGMDPMGGDSIEDIIEQNAADNTLLVFPEGTYKVDRFSLSGLSNFGMVAATGASPTFVPARPRDEMGEVIMASSGLHNFVFAGIDFDYTQNGYGGRLYVNTDGDGVVCGVEMKGAFPNESKGFRVEVREPDATLLLDRIVINGQPEQPSDDTNGIYVGNPHAGTIIIRDTRIENCTNNGIYASSPGSPEGGNGPVIVEGGVYKNNNISNVRIGSSGSIVRNVTVIVDQPVPVFHGAQNSRGIRVRDRKDQLIDNCDIYYGPNGSSGSGAIAIHKEAGRVRVRNTRIKIDKDNQPAIRAKVPVTSNDGGPVLEGVSITGAASGDRAVLISSRQNTQISDLCIHQTGSDRDGVVLRDSTGGSIVDSTIDVTGEAIVQSNSSIDVQNLSTSGNCPEPTLAP